MGNAPDRRRFPRMPVRPSAAVVLIIAVAGFLILFSALSQVSGPPGADGYYYLKQIEVLSYGGGYYYKDRSLAFLFPAALAVLTGNALTAFRLTVAVTAVLLIVAGGMVASTLATAAEIKNKTGIAVSLITTSVLTCSLTVYEFTFEYYKNAFALLLLMAAIIAAYGGTAEAKRRPFIATLLVMAAFLSHKSAIFFVMSFMLLWFLRNATRRNFLVLLGSGAVSLVAFLAFFEQGRNYLLALPGFLTGAAPWTDWIGYALRKDAAFSITLCADFLIIVLYILRRRDLPVRAALLCDTACGVSAAALVPFFAAGPAGPVYRVVLFSPLFLLPVLLTGAARTPSRNTMVGTSVILVIFVSQVFIDQNRLSSHFASWSGLEKNIGLLTKHVTRKDHLIAHHGLEFYVDYRTGIRARQFTSSDIRKKSFRLAYVPDGRPGGPARDALNASKLEQIGDSYALFREEDWQRIAGLYRIKPHWKNPTVVRPNYIPDYE